MVIMRQIVEFNPFCYLDLILNLQSSKLVARTDNISLYMTLLNSTRFNSRQNRTALHVAMTSDSPDIQSLRHLLKVMTNVNIGDNAQDTPLHLACVKDFTGRQRSLLTLGFLHNERGAHFKLYWQIWNLNGIVIIVLEGRW